ncbi:MAG: serine--tRNA ligase [Candidatus Pacebacteria bacterium]|nr:serine--tRNA ligase [Candidatus Paceibacterota bacterium]MDD3919131.1 serine--tRNA ligase [Candidatus Paceibacterota bacterium]
MLDIKFIRQNIDVVKDACNKKQINSDIIDQLVEVDRKRSELMKSVENTRRLKNEANERIKNASSEEKKAIIEEMKKVSDDEKEFQEIDKEFERLMLLVPNVPHSSVPNGSSDEDNVEVKNWGTIPNFDFPIKDHVELAKDLDLVDFDRGNKVSGFRGYYLKNEAALLSFAIWNFALEKLIAKGFVPMIAPSLVRESALVGTGYLPQQEEDVYKTDDGMYLAGTSEVALMNYHSGETLSKEELPKKYVGFSPCFRTEIGSYGKDVKGILRVHEFYKLEQVILCESSQEEIEKLHEEITRNSEEVLEALELPYRRVLNCSGDLGLGQVKKFDLEAWVPSQNRYRETHSASYFYDFQTRRLNIKYKEGGGEVKYTYSLNNTLIATPRVLISLFENHQQKDGSIKIPEALHKYLNFTEIKLKNE